jgi:serine/threonine protein kinase
VLVQVVDFGFAKKLPRGEKSFTVCGTPEYLAPELVNGEGHDRGVDYWALGVLIYEMLVGYSPFAGAETPEQMVVCRNILEAKYRYPPLPLVGAASRDIIAKLLTVDNSKRLGMSNVRRQFLSSVGLVTNSRSMFVVCVFFTEKGHKGN